jgi:general stress protein 26
MSTRHTIERPADYEKLAELIQDIRVAMLTTFPEGDAPVRSRPMYTQAIDLDTFDGTLWFMTDAESGKVHELAENSAVLITYAAPSSNRFVVVQGRAQAVRDVQKAQELWNIHAKGWWPNGPADANLLLIEVQVETAEYWDGPSNVSYMLNLLTAVAQGKRVTTKADHGTLP